MFDTANLTMSLSSLCNLCVKRRRKCATKCQ